jgi:hypothetical protein
MDEIGFRIDAHEMALIDAAGHIDEDNVIAAMRAIRAGLVGGILEDGRPIRLRVLELLEVALQRSDRCAATGLH